MLSLVEYTTSEEAKQYPFSIASWMLSNLGFNSPFWITESKSTTWHLKPPGALTACALTANWDNAPAIPNSDLMFLGTLNVIA